MDMQVLIKDLQKILDDADMALDDGDEDEARVNLLAAKSLLDAEFVKD